MGEPRWPLPQHGHSDLPAPVGARGGQAPIPPLTLPASKRMTADTKPNPRGSGGAQSCGLRFEEEQPRRGGRDAGMRDRRARRPDRQTSAAGPVLAAGGNRGRQARGGGVRGKAGLRRRGSGGGVPRLRGRRVSPPPTPSRCYPHSSPAEKLRASPGLTRPPASGARKRPHIAGGWAGGTSVLLRLCLRLVSRRKLVWSLGRGRARRKAGGLTAAQRRPRSEGARLAAVAAAAMAQPALRLRPGPGKRRLRRDCSWIPG